MPVQTADIQLYRAGAASLGGAASQVVVSLASLFDPVTAPESAVGDVEYRCAYLGNDSAQTWNSVFAWLSANTPSISTQIDIGLGSAAINGIEQTIGDEGTPPANVAFIAAGSKGAGLAVGAMPGGARRSIWFKRTIATGTAAVSDTFTLQTEGTTAA